MADGPSPTISQGAFNVGGSILGGMMPIILLLALLVVAAGEQAMELLKQWYVWAGIVVVWLLWRNR